MSIPVFPPLPFGYPGKRTAIWKSNNQEATSGKETLISLWSFPRWKWELPFEVLRTLAATPDFYTLANFYNSTYGATSAFLFTDPDDHSVLGQGIGAGDGTTTLFQLVRALGGAGFVEPIYAPNAVSNVYVNGVVQSPSSYSVGAYGSSNPGQITFATAPVAGAAVAADFSYYFPCRFTDDRVDFDLILQGVYAMQTLAFQSLK